MLDDETGEALYQRADDTAEALKTRLVPPPSGRRREGASVHAPYRAGVCWARAAILEVNYHAQTEPVMAHYDKQNMEVALNLLEDLLQTGHQPDDIVLTHLLEDLLQLVFKRLLLFADHAAEQLLLEALLRYGEVDHGCLRL